MAKKLSESSRPAKLTSVSAESIWSKPLSERQRSVLEGVATRQASGDETQIDYSDIPALTDRQLTEIRRPAKKLVAVRLDTDVLAWLQQYGSGYSTRINEILRVVMAQRQ